MSHLDEAVERMRLGHACSQAILEVHGPDHGLPVESARRMAAALAGGMRLGGPCGALSAAFLVLGLARAGGESQQKPERDRLAALTGEFARRFAAEAGGLTCPEILGCDVRSEEGRARMAAEGLGASRCLPAVRCASRLLDEFLAPPPAV